MPRLFRRTKRLAVDFCGRCGSVCVVAWREAALAEVRDRATAAHGWRLA